MPKTRIDPAEAMGAMAEEDAPVLETVLKMNLDTLEFCSLDPRTYNLVRLAALVATNAPPMSYMVNLSSAQESGVTAEDAQGVLVAVAPLTGTPRITAAAGNVLRGLGIVEALSES